MRRLMGPGRSSGVRSHINRMGSGRSSGVRSPINGMNRSNSGLGFWRLVIPLQSCRSALLQMCTLSRTAELLVGVILGDQFADRLGKEILVTAPGPRCQNTECLRRRIGRIEICPEVILSRPLATRSCCTRWRGRRSRLMIRLGFARGGGRYCRPQQGSPFRHNQAFTFAGVQFITSSNMCFCKAAISKAALPFGSCSMTPKP